MVAFNYYNLAKTAEDPEGNTKKLMSLVVTLEGKINQYDAKYAEAEKQIKVLEEQNLKDNQKAKEL